MKLQEFSVSIAEGNETDDGYVQMTHATPYTIVLCNDGDFRCDADVSVDGRLVGTWRVNKRETVGLERPVHDTGRFTFYQTGTPEAAAAGIREDANTGLIRVIFKPEMRFFTLNSIDPLAAGGTGLSGQSAQRFTNVAALDHDEARFVTITLRLVALAHRPRPLFPQSNPVPPPVGGSR